MDSQWDETCCLDCLVVVCWEDSHNRSFVSAAGVLQPAQCQMHQFVSFHSGDGEYGCKTLVAQACEYCEAALCHPHNFEPPRVVFLFTGQVLSTVSAALHSVHVYSESMDQVLRGTSTLFHCSADNLDIPLSLSQQPSQGEMQTVASASAFNFS